MDFISREVSHRACQPGKQAQGGKSSRGSDPVGNFDSVQCEFFRGFKIVIVQLGESCWHKSCAALPSLSKKSSEEIQFMNSILKSSLGRWTLVALISGSAAMASAGCYSHTEKVVPVAEPAASVPNTTSSTTTTTTNDGTVKKDTTTTYTNP